MTPLLTGVFASQISGHLTPAFSPTGSYDALATYTVPSGGVSTITFAGLPTGGQYTHLQIRVNALAGADDGYITFNNDSTYTNYYRHYLWGNGSSAAAGANNAPYIDPGATSATYPSVYVFDILDYASTTKYKTVRELFGYDYNGSGRLGINSVLWKNTDAINTISFTGRSYSQHSQFAIYGVK